MTSSRHHYSGSLCFNQIKPVHSQSGIKAGLNEHNYADSRIQSPPLATMR